MSPGSSPPSRRCPSTWACWSGAGRWRWYPGRFTWDDVGTWDALPRVRRRDSHGNVSVGPVFLSEAEDCVVWSAGDPVVLSGLKDVVVVHANGRILVMSRRRAAELKSILDQLPPEVRDIP